MSVAVTIWTIAQCRAAAIVLCRFADKLAQEQHFVAHRYVLVEAAAMLLPRAAGALDPEADFDLALRVGGVCAAERVAHIATIAALEKSA